MRLTTRLIAFAWMLVGAITLVQALQGVPVPFSLRFFAVIQVFGGIALLAKMPFGYIALITMSVFTMVAGILALFTVPFMPLEVAQNAPSLFGLDPRWTLVLFAGVAIVFGRLCWLGLSLDPPSQWQTGREEEQE